MSLTSVLLMGNEAIARGALEAGVNVATAYPGTPSTEIMECLIASKERNLYLEWSVNEKVALEVAAAASFAGLRSLCAMKQNGVNVASDFLLHLALSGTKGGIVLVSCDDPGAFSSMNEEDSRFFAPLFEIPLLEPGDFQQAKDMTRWAFELSEDLKSIVMVRSVTRLSQGSGNVVLGPLPEGTPLDGVSLSGDPVTCAPVVLKHSHQQEKVRKAQTLFENSPFNRYTGPESPDLLIIASGVCGLYSREAVHVLGLPSQIGVLQLATTWPLPGKLIWKYLSKTKKVLIVEEVLPFLEEKVKALAAEVSEDKITFYGKNDGTIPAVGEVTPDTVMEALSKIRNVPYRVQDGETISLRIPERKLTFCPGCPHRASFWSIYSALSLDNRKGFVCGDIGCYTLDLFNEFSTLKTVHSMGSGIGIASGLGKLTQFGVDEPVLAVCGDSTFFHAGIPALINAVHAQSRVTLIILDNSGSAMTGFQPHPGTPFNACGEKVPFVDIAEVCEAVGAKVEVKDPFDLEGTQKTLLRMMQDTKVNVLILRQACALSPEKKSERKRMYIDEKKCIGEECGCSRFCTQIFCCPGLVWNKEKRTAVIDEVICTGCGVCTNICPERAIRERIE